VISTLKKIILKIFKKIIGKRLFYKILGKNVTTVTAEKFLEWWKDFKKSNKLDSDLVSMINDLTDSHNFNKYSPYWNHLAQGHIKLLQENGIENFKQTIERFHYWGEGNFGSKFLQPIWDDEIIILHNPKELQKKHEFCTQQESLEYNKANLVLLNYLVNNGYEKYLKQLQEKNFGNPILFNYENKNYSHSLLNSILEIDVIKKNITFKENNSILEIGAGSGRICSALLQIEKNLNYTIVDIAPTLYVAQTNLSNFFKEKKIFKYRKFNNFEEIEKEFISSDIRFLLPEQIRLIPNKFFNLSIAVDCLHEFNKNQVEEYFNEFNRLSKFFYFKCQNTQSAIFERKEKYNISNYPVKNNWEKKMHEKCFIPNGYFQALYKIN
jgi:putative sugar O-methyltransferase